MDGKGNLEEEREGKGDGVAKEEGEVVGARKGKINESTRWWSGEREEVVLVANERL